MNSIQPRSALSHLECSGCGGHFEADEVQTFCQECNSPLLARYDLETVRGNLGRGQVKERQPGLWRWAELLPVRDPTLRITLGEGDTPILPVANLGAQLGLAHLYLKDESRNPTGTFKARGLAVAVGRGLELGIRKYVIPSAGNAGAALANYAARAGCEAHVFMPSDAPLAIQREVGLAGAKLHLVEGLIDAAARQAAAENPGRNSTGDQAAGPGWFDVSTFKEPYRLEGKKTMGLEIAEGFHWDLPEVIVYPTGGGTGLVGIWKAFEELEVLGWIQEKRPRMVSVQAEGCAPIVRAFEIGARHAERWEQAQTIAAGLRVPHPFADRLILATLYASSGIAVAVSDEEILSAGRQLAQGEGILAAPEAAATIAALPALLEKGWLHPGETILAINTGSGLKYLS